MIHLGPVEIAVLDHCGERWQTLEELESALLEQFSREDVAAAVHYLRTNKFLASHGMHVGREIYHLTIAGTQVLHTASRSQEVLFHAE